MNRSWTPDYLARWLFNQSRYWITADGVQITVSKMDRSHALNTILMLERVQDDIAKAIRQPVQTTMLYVALKDHVEQGILPSASESRTT